VLDSQRALYAAQESLFSVKLSRLQNLVTLYKALGVAGTSRLGRLNTRRPLPRRRENWTGRIPSGAASAPQSSGSAIALQVPCIK
jgi:hypothetical protein